MAKTSKQNAVLYISVISCIILFILTISIYIRLKTYSEICDAMIKYSEEMTEYAHHKDILLDDIKTVFNNQDLNLNPDTELFEHTDTSIILLKDIVKHKKKFVFYFSEFNCDTCIDALIPLIKELSNNIGPDNIILLCKYKRIQDLLRFKRVNHINCQVYNLGESTFPLMERNIPFCCIIEPNMRMTHLFIPHKEMLDFSKKIFDCYTHTIQWE